MRYDTQFFVSTLSRPTWACGLKLKRSGFTITEFVMEMLDMIVNEMNEFKVDYTRYYSIDEARAHNFDKFFDGRSYSVLSILCQKYLDGIDLFYHELKENLTLVGNDEDFSIQLIQGVGYSIVNILSEYYLDEWVDIRDSLTDEEYFG